MNSSFRPLTFITAALIWAASSLWAQANLPKNTTTTNFMLPITKNGEKDMLVEGKSATSFGSFVTITGTRITLYQTSERNSKVTLFCPKASYNMSQQTASSNERVNIRIYPAEAESAKQPYNTVLDGVGFDLSKKDQVLKIRSRVKVSIIPAKPGAGNSTMVTSKELIYDLVNRKLILSGDVEVHSKSPETEQDYSLSCDRLTVFTGTDGRPNSMTGKGHVKLTQGSDEASAEKAIYRRLPPPEGAKPDTKTGTLPKYMERFILSGTPVVKTETQSLQHADKVIIDQYGKDRKVHTVGGKPEVLLKKTDRSKSLIPMLSNPTSPPAADSSDK